MKITVQYLLVALLQHVGCPASFTCKYELISLYHLYYGICLIYFITKLKGQPARCTVGTKCKYRNVLLPWP